jgi:hypothetical protein
MRNAISLRAYAMAGALIALVGGTANAGTVTLKDDNSTAVFNTQSQSGLHTWLVDGVDQMFQEWFWIRSGNTAEVSIDTAWVSDFASDTNGDGNNDTLFSTFNNGVWEIQTSFSLTGGSLTSGTSDMAETIRIRNVSGSTRQFSFFEYSDFDLKETIGDDTGVFDNLNSIHQFDATGGLVEVIGAPNFTRWEIAPYATILNKLNDGVATNLSNTVSPLFGDVTFAMQWDFTLANNGTFIISKDKLITAVPEPSSVLLLSGGLAAVGWGATRRLRKSGTGA